jgi:hypothetical protein
VQNGLFSWMLTGRAAIDYVPSAELWTTGVVLGAVSAIY